MTDPCNLPDAERISDEWLDALINFYASGCGPMAIGAEKGLRELRALRWQVAKELREMECFPSSSPDAPVSAEPKGERPA